MASSKSARGISTRSSPTLSKPSAVRRYHDALLYTVAYPNSESDLAHANAELQRIACHVGEASASNSDTYENSGIAGSSVCSAFSLELNTWFIERFPGTTSVWASSVETQTTVETLNHCLDPIEQELMHAGRMDWDYWSQKISGQGAHQTLLHEWIVRTAANLPGTDAFREHTFSRFAIQSIWKSPTDGVSLTTGRAPHLRPFVHTGGLLKRVDLQEQLNSGKPKRITTSARDRQQLVDLTRGVLAHMTRETDPSTYANAAEVEYYDLGRGTTIALFPMRSGMKMALQSYIGFMAFKNGVACAYGGGWLLFGESGFGINILPPFRGGESALLVSNLLRLFHDVYRVDAFTVDPYQIGYDNPEGIASGAFWFYYRLGFRPTQRSLASLAKSEWGKIQSDRSYRTSAGVLEALSNATMRWRVRGHSRRTSLNADALSDVVTSWIGKHHGGNRLAAQKAAVARIRSITGKPLTIRHPISRIAVLLSACQYLDNVSGAELRKLVADYAGKQQHEGQYVRASQKYHALFDQLVSATRRR